MISEYFGGDAHTAFLFSFGMGVLFVIGPLSGVFSIPVIICNITNENREPKTIAITSLSLSLAAIIVSVSLLSIITVKTKLLGYPFGRVASIFFLLILLTAIIAKVYIAYKEINAVVIFSNRLLPFIISVVAALFFVQAAAAPLAAMISYYREHENVLNMTSSLIGVSAGFALVSGVLAFLISLSLKNRNVKKRALSSLIMTIVLLYLLIRPGYFFGPLT